MQLTACLMSDRWWIERFQLGMSECVCINSRGPSKWPSETKKNNQPGAHNEILMFLPSLLLHSHSFLLVHFLWYISSVFFSITHKKEREREIDREI